MLCSICRRMSLVYQAILNGLLTKLKIKVYHAWFIHRAMSAPNQFLGIIARCINRIGSLLELGSPLTVPHALRRRAERS